MNTPHDHRDALRVAITGGTSGLGLALVEVLHRRGAAVAFVARDAERVATVARRFPGTHGIVGDVARKDDAHRIALQIGAALGGLDVLVNNASSLGPVPLRPLADTDCEDLEAALATNLVGPFRLTKALLGALGAAAREGRTRGHDALVVNISSDAAVTPYGGWGAYGASKAALTHMSRIWDEEMREHGVRLIALDPGDMDTPLHALAVPDADRATLKQPRDAARDVVAAIEAARGASIETATAASVEATTGAPVEATLGGVVEAARGAAVGPAQVETARRSPVVAALPDTPISATAGRIEAAG